MPVGLLLRPSRRQRCRIIKNTRLAAPKSGPQVHGMCDEHVGWLLMQPLAKELAKLGFVVPRRRRNLGETKPALADSQAAAGVVLFETPSRY